MSSRTFFGKQNSKVNLKEKQEWPKYFLKNKLHYMDAEANVYQIHQLDFFRQYVLNVANFPCSNWQFFFLQVKEYYV